MHSYLMDMLECPACHGKLAWKFIERSEDRIEAGEARCEACASVYPVRDGIGLFLTPDLPREDLWEQADSGLVQYLHEHPELEQQLMGGPLKGLAPADRFFRALILESQGQFREAQSVEASANRELYTPEHIKCWNSQMDYVVERLAHANEPIIDLASGRCYLVEKYLQRLTAPIVATDFSPSVLRRDRQWLESFGLDERVSLLALDARRTPFKDGVVRILTTNLGLPNIMEQDELLKELRRIVSGVFLAVSHFFPENDEVNGAAIREAGLEKVLYRAAALENFQNAGWSVEAKNSCTAFARPTPTSRILEGAGIDSFPVKDTILEWCVMEGTAEEANLPRSSR